MIDLLALGAIARETEVTYIRRERDWVVRAQAEGRLQPDRLLPVLPAGIVGGDGRDRGRSDGHSEPGDGVHGDAAPGASGG
jgi:hypothetical protein